MRKLKLEELGRDNLSEYRSKAKVSISVVLDNLRSAMNVGSFFRTMDCFAIEKLYLTGISAKPPHPEINKTAIGATLSVEWEYHKDILELVTELKSSHHILGIEQTTESVALESYELQTDKPMVLIFGNEVNGLSESILPLLDKSIEIPQYGTKHSLNVAVCGGVVLHHFASKLKQL
jgi:tRNA G18 (ribose-2'-O)-methylase SpoU